MSPNSSATNTILSPIELRAVFGQNLRILCQKHSSISSICRDLGINRTQFNRYLSGESFPRPDVLHRICTFFKTDARILLEPLQQIEARSEGALSHPEMREYFGPKETDILPEIFPSGFFRFSRHSFGEKSRFVQGLIFVYKKNYQMFLRGMEAKEAVAGQGLDANAKTREFRGFVIAQEGGVAMLAFRRGSTSCSFSYLSPTPSFQNNFWLGYTTRTFPEHINCTRVTRLVFEHLGQKRSEIMATARQAGICESDNLWPYHRTLLRPNEAFS